MAKYSMASGGMAREAEAENSEPDLSFNPPENLDSDLKGDEGKAECSWERKPDGKICITAINGVSVGKYAGMDDAKEEESEGEPASQAGDETEE